MNRILTALVVILTGLLAEVGMRAESSSMRVRVQVTDDAAVYSLPTGDDALAQDGWLQQSDISMSGTVEMHFKTSGEPPQDTRQVLNSQEIPGKNGQRGYSRARLRQIAGRIELMIDSLEIKDEPVKDAQGKPTGQTHEKRTARQYGVPLEFAPKGGSWRDYEDGKTVELRFTREAVKSILQRAKLEAHNSSYVEAPESGKASLSITVNQSKVPGHKAADFGKVTASKRRLDVIQIPTDVLIVMKISL